MNADDFLHDPLPAGLDALPAMVRPAEQQLLYNLARHRCAGRGEVVELGAFFGASTAALAAGLKDRGATNCVRTFDRFECASASVFAREVRSRAAEHGLEPLLAERDGRLDFLACFERVTQAHAGWIAATRTELSTLRWEGDIELLHVDMPKTYAQLREAVRRTYRFLVSGAFVVLQDYLYHWSAELIAATVALVQRGLLAPIALIESSLVMQAERAVADADAAWLDAQMRDVRSVVILIEEGAARLKSPFVRAVVRLAGAQYRAAHGMAAEAEVLIDEVLAQTRAEIFAANMQSRARELRAARFTLPD